MYTDTNVDELVKSLKNRIFVIPVKTGIQDFQTVKIKMDSRLRGNDDFLRVHQCYTNCAFPGRGACWKKYNWHANVYYRGKIVFFIKKKIDKADKGVYTFAFKMGILIQTQTTPVIVLRFF